MDVPLLRVSAHNILIFSILLAVATNVSSTEDDNGSPILDSLLRRL